MDAYRLANGLTSPSSSDKLQPNYSMPQHSKDNVYVT